MLKLPKCVQCVCAENPFLISQVKRGKQSFDTTRLKERREADKSENGAATGRRQLSRTSKSESG